MPAASGRLTGWRNKCDEAGYEAEMQAFGFNDVWVDFKKLIRQYGAQRGGQENQGQDGTGQMGFTRVIEGM